MRESVRRWLSGIVQRLEHTEKHTGTPALDPRDEVAYLERQLQAIEQDEVSLRAMLAAQTDSFHHSIAAGTTTHAESLRERKAAMVERIESLTQTRKRRPRTDQESE